MKKFVSLFLILTVAFVGASSAFSQPYHIRLGNFPQNTAYLNHVSEFLPYFNLVSVWQPEWKHDIPKEKLITLMTSLIRETEVFTHLTEKDNLDLVLFQALLKACLYNLDVEGSYEQAVSDLEAIKKKFPDDYRAYWILGNHYGFSNVPFAAIREYDYLFDHIFKGNIPQDVMMDYLHVSFLACMYAKCKATIDMIATHNQIKDVDERFWMYERLTRLLQEPPANNEIPKESLYYFQERESGFGFLSSIFGIWLPAKESWKVNFTDTTKDNKAVFYLSVPLESKEGNNIEVSIAVFFQALPKNTFQEFAHPIPSMKKSLKVDSWNNRWDAQVYEYWNPDRYKENGGGHGYYIFVKRGQPKTKGWAIDAPARIPYKSDEARYYTLNNGYTRFDGDIYYMFLLDSCEAVFNESKKEFFDLLDKVLFD